MCVVLCWMERGQKKETKSEKLYVLVEEFVSRVCVCVQIRNRKKIEEYQRTRTTRPTKRLLDGTIADATIDKGIRIATPIWIGTFTAVLHDDTFPKGGPMLDPDMMRGIHGR